MLKKILSMNVLTLILFSGCAEPKVSNIIAPDGSNYKIVKCNKDSLKCLNEASISCDNKSYQVISSESHAGGVFADYLAGPVTWYSMTYKCGLSDGKMPDFKFVGQEYNPPANIVVPSSNYSQPAYSKPTTTNCYKIGNNINCTSF